MQLAEQLRFLRASARAFDAGDESEAKRLSAVIRVLVHDRGSNKSLLGQLGLLGIGFFDTARYINPRNLSTEWAIVLARFSASGIRYIAPLDDSPRGVGHPVEFPAWWHKAIFRGEDRGEITRHDLVLSMAENDGGVHVDPKLRPKYAGLSRQNSLGLSMILPDGQAIPVEGAHLAGVRQIAHELMKSIDIRAAPTRPPLPDYINVRGLGRNDPCPCRSGRKYKSCHGFPNSTETTGHVPHT